MVAGMNKYNLFLMLFFVSTFAFANESRTILGRSVEIIDNDDTNITMQEVKIIITLHRDYYEVSVAYIFYNEGSEETVLMGFPIIATFQDHPAEREWATINDFRSYINDVLITEYIIKEEESYYRWHITNTKWFLRNVTFQGNQNTSSKVTYSAPYNHFGFFRNAGYIFGTARNWSGNIVKMTIIINHGDDIIIDRLSIGDNRAYEFIWLGDGKYKFVLEDFEPEINERITIFITPFDLRRYANEFGDWAMGWIWYNHLLYRNFTDIRFFTRNQVQLFINFFYAFHGYNFQDSELREFFENVSFFDFRNTRYIVNQNFSENNFNEYERRNIAYLRNLKGMIPFNETDLSMNVISNESNRFNFNYWKYGIIISGLIIVYIIFKRIRRKM